MVGIKILVLDKLKNKTGAIAPLIKSITLQ